MASADDFQAFSKDLSDLVKHSFQELTGSFATEVVSQTAQIAAIQDSLLDSQNHQGTPGVARAPTFKGNGQDPIAFLEQFELYSDFCRWKPDKKFKGFPLSLVGNAQVWYSTLDKETYASFDELREAFLTQFSSPATNWVLRQELSERKQGPAETLNDYISDIRKRCQRLKIPASESIHHFIQGLLPNLKHYVILQQPKTLEEAENAAKLKFSVSTQAVPAVTKADILALQEGFINRLKTEHLLPSSAPPVAVFDAHQATYRPNTNSYDRSREFRRDNITPRNNNSAYDIRKIIREELNFITRNRATNQNFASQGRPYYNARGDFGRNSRTTDGQVICHQCNRVGHVARNCQAPRHYDSDPRIPQNRSANSPNRKFPVRSSQRVNQNSSN